MMTSVLARRRLGAITTSRLLRQPRRTSTSSAGETKPSFAAEVYNAWTWFTSRSPPSNFVHLVVVTCQTCTVGIASYRYLRDSQAEEGRREDAAALASLDRCAQYYNVRYAERIVLDLEAYRNELQREEERRARWAWLFGGSSTPQSWAEVWLDRRNAGDPRAREMEAHRCSIKNLWFLGKQAWESYPDRHNLLAHFFFDSPLNAQFGRRCLLLCEPMDIARMHRRGVAYNDVTRPDIYRFMEAIYELNAETADAHRQHEDVVVVDAQWEDTADEAHHWRDMMADHLPEYLLSSKWAKSITSQAKEPPKRKLRWVDSYRRAPPLPAAAAAAA